MLGCVTVCLVGAKLAPGSQHRAVPVACTAHVVSCDHDLRTHVACRRGPWHRREADAEGVWRRRPRRRRRPGPGRHQGDDGAAGGPAPLQADPQAGCARHPRRRVRAGRGAPRCHLCPGPDVHGVCQLLVSHRASRTVGHWLLCLGPDKSFLQHCMLPQRSSRGCWLQAAFALPSACSVNLRRLRVCDGAHANSSTHLHGACSASPQRWSKWMCVRPQKDTTLRPQQTGANLVFLSARPEMYKVRIGLLSRLHGTAMLPTGYPRNLLPAIPACGSEA